MSNYIKQVIPVGKLDWGVYPTPNTIPIIYLYYRPNGDLMLYRTADDLEVNLTNLSSYDNIILFKFYDKDSISELDITQFHARTLNVAKAEYIRPYVRSRNKYSYILVPAIFGVQAIFLNDELVTPLYDMIGVYEHKEQFYFVYKSRTSISIEGEQRVVVVIDRLSQEHINAFIRHLEDYDDPHKTIEKITEEHLFSTVSWKIGNEEFENINLYIIEGTTEELNEVPIINKQVLLDTLTGSLYVDVDNKRLPFGGGGTKKIINGDADLLIETGTYICSGSKTNFPLDINDLDFNNSDFNFILETDIIGGITPYTQQLIRLQDKVIIRVFIQGVFSDWTLIDFESSKQNKIDTSLETDNKDIVDAINELNTKFNSMLNGMLLSDTIDRIEVVTELPTEMHENTLYIEVIPYEDGIGNMIINPPFIVH